MSNPKNHPKAEGKRVNRRVPLTRDLLYRMKLEKRPCLDSDNKIVFQAFKGREYIVYDSHQKAPKGFGVRVGKTSFKFIVQRKVGKSITKWVVGDCRDMTLEAAREEARAQIGEVRKTQEHPRRTRARLAEGDLSLRKCFEEYKQSLEDGKRKVKQNTLDSLAKGRKRLAEFEDSLVADIKPTDILNWFDKSAKTARTATEAAARWAIVSVNTALAREILKAQSEHRNPQLLHNPFLILRQAKKFRTRAELELSYREKGIRNPMTEESLAKWLNVVWAKRASNPTGADFLILTLLWGMRRGEAAKVKWRHRISADEARVSSWVDLKKREVFLADPKNRIDHSLPLAPCAYELLRRREEDSRALAGDARRWVFPARSPKSAAGHYSDPNEFLRGIRKQAEIEFLRPHDLRRTFGRMAESMNFSTIAIQRLLNHQNSTSATPRYAEIEDKRLHEYMARIENAILSLAPEVHRSLSPIMDNSGKSIGGGDERKAA